MFKFKPVSFAFLTSIAMFILLDIRYDVSWYFYASSFLIYSIFIVWGSFSIRSQFYAKAITRFETTSREVALTFDDGPDVMITSQVLTLLKAANVHATFFCIGKKLKENAELIKKIYDEGHTIGLHSYSHAYLFDFYPANKVVKDLRHNQKLVKEIIGEVPVCFRPPYGVTNPAIGKAVPRMALHVIGWSVRSLDTVIRDEAKIVKRISNKIRPGSIILLHDHLTQTPSVLASLLKEIDQKGYKVVPLPQALNLEFYDKSEMIQ